MAPAQTIPAHPDLPRRVPPVTGKSSAGAKLSPSAAFTPEALVRYDEATATITGPRYSLLIDTVHHNRPTDDTEIIRKAWEFCLRHPETRDVCDIGQMLFWNSKAAWYLTAIMFLLNIPWDEAQIAGGLFGTKVVLNEFVAFIDLGNLTKFSDRSRAIWRT